MRKIGIVGVAAVAAVAGAGASAATAAAFARRREVPNQEILRFRIRMITNHLNEIEALLNSRYTQSSPMRLEYLERITQIRILMGGTLSDVVMFAAMDELVRLVSDVTKSVTLPNRLDFPGFGDSGNGLLTTRGDRPPFS